MLSSSCGRGAVEVVSGYILEVLLSASMVVVEIVRGIYFGRRFLEEASEDSGGGVIWRRLRISRRTLSGALELNCRSRLAEEAALAVSLGVLEAFLSRWGTATGRQLL